MFSCFVFPRQRQRQRVHALQLQSIGFALLVLFDCRLCSFHGLLLDYQ